MISLNIITISCLFGFWDYLLRYRHFLFRIALSINWCLLIRLDDDKKQEVTVAERIDENIIQSTEEDEIIFVPLVTEVNI
jgi:hypothetical protein